MVLCAGPMLSVTYPPTVWYCILPMAFGLLLSTVKEATFNWAGFSAALASNAGMALRAIYSKQHMSVRQRHPHALS